MKKILISIVALLYMAVSSGIAMDIHYCMGKKIGVDFYSNENNLCGKCGMKHKKGCCGDEHKFYKLSDSHKNISNDISFTTSSVALNTAYPIYIEQFPINLSLQTYTDYSPPDYSKRPVRLLNGVFRL